MKRKMITLTLIIITLLLGACSGQALSSDEEMISLVERFQTARNEGDWELAASFLAEDVVWETPTGSLTGRDNWIASVQNGPTIIEYVKSRHVKDNLVIVEMVVEGPDFVSPATVEAVVEDGKIQRYTITPP